VPKQGSKDDSMGFAHVPMLYDVFGVRGSMFDEG